MTKSLQVAMASGLCAVAVVVWLWLSLDSDSGARTAGSLSEGDLPQGATVTSESPASPFAVEADASESGTSARSATGTPDKAQSGASEPESDSSATVLATTIDVSQLARTSISDEDFDAIVSQLRADPALLQRLIDEFRQEQNPDRRNRLMRLLGYAGGPDITLLASELVYSGDEQSRELGLQMLQRAQPGSAEVQQIASALLATVIEPRVVVSTLATLARPGTVVSEDRTLVADQVALMASHSDPGVRGVSLDVLSRLSTDGRDTPVLIAGLADESARVREAAAYALVEHENGSDAVDSALWQLLRDPEETAPARSAALMALRSLAPTAEEEVELTAIERQLNTIDRPR